MGPRPLIALFAFIVRPLWTAPDLNAIAERAHGWTVFVAATSGADSVSASGVLIPGGLVVTDLHGLLFRRPDGTVAPAEIVVMVDGIGPLPALLAGFDAELGLAVLKLPDQVRGLPGAAIATTDPGVADQLLAMGNDGKGVDVLGVKVDHVDHAWLHTTSRLPAAFRGGPLFDTSGNLAALELAFGVAAASSVVRLLEQK